LHPAGTAKELILAKRVAAQNNGLLRTGWIDATSNLDFGVCASSATTVVTVRAMAIH
jgi:hypothetical protein